MIRHAFAALVVSSVLLVTGCPNSAPSTPAPTAPATAPTPATGTAPAPAPAAGGRVTAAEWCPEHGVPEAVCTRCNASLIDSYKAKKDWCAEHTMPESQCITCNPEVAAKWQAMAPAAAPR